MDLKEGLGNVNWIKLTEGIIRWWACVLKVMKVLVQKQKILHYVICDGEIKGAYFSVFEL